MAVELRDSANDSEVRASCGEDSHCDSCAVDGGRVREVELFIGPRWLPCLWLCDRCLDSARIGPRQPDAPDELLIVAWLTGDERVA
jgi:hypothetical protein